jgi:hypothetical protein
METIKNLIIFGAIRGLIKHQFIKDREKVLVTERVGMALAGGVTFPVIFPYAIYKDVRRIEVALRGLDSEQYNTKIEKPKDVVL